ISPFLQLIGEDRERGRGHIARDVLDKDDGRVDGGRDGEEAGDEMTGLWIVFWFRERFFSAAGGRVGSAWDPSFKNIDLREPEKSRSIECELLHWGFDCDRLGVPCWVGLCTLFEIGRFDVDSEFEAGLKPCFFETF